MKDIQVCRVCENANRANCCQPTIELLAEVLARFFFLQAEPSKAKPLDEAERKDLCCDSSSSGHWASNLSRNGKGLVHLFGISLLETLRSLFFDNVQWKCFACDDFLFTLAKYFYFIPPLPIN
jgi:hypothetical protein